MDLTNVKQYFEELKERYKEKIASLADTREHDNLRKGIGALEGIKVMTGELANQVDLGCKSIEGTNSLMRRAAGVKSEYDKKCLEGLSDAYYGEVGVVKRLMGRLPIVGRKYPTLKDALTIVENVAEKIPEYVERLSKELDERGQDLATLRTGLRNNIEGFIHQRRPLEEDISKLEAQISKIEREHNDLEDQRYKNSSDGKETPLEIIEKLQLYELSLESGRSLHSELKARKDRLQANIDLTNNQIGKVGQLGGLLDETRHVVHNAREFVDVQVPYVLEEIASQRTQISSLAGIEQVSRFLETQARHSVEINERIHKATAYLG